MAKRSLWLIIGAVIIIAVIIIGIQRTQKPTPEEKVIKIGAILPLTGELSLFGQWLKEGISLAVQNKQVQVIYEDNKNQTSLSISAFQKLITVDKVQGIITARTPVAYALSSLVSQSQVPTVYTFADLPEQITGCVVNYHFPTKDEVELLAKFMKNIGQKAVILTVNDEFGRLAATLFKEKFKGVIVFEEMFDSKQTDFRSILVKIPRNSDFIFLIAYEQNFVNLVKQLNEYKILLPLVGPNVLTVFFHLVESHLTMPVYVTMSLYDAGLISDNKFYQEFKVKFIRAYGREPNMVNAEAYEAMRYLIRVLSQGFSSREELCKFMTEPRLIPSLFGNIKIDSNGQAHFPLAVVKVHKKRKQVLTTWNP